MSASYTPGVSRLPYAMAGRSAKAGTDLYDEPASAGDVGLALAARSWRPGRSSPLT